jgi:hypothetical protein
MTMTRYEASNDGSVCKTSGSSYSISDYEIKNRQYAIRIYGNEDSSERRAYKRFIMDMGSSTIISATLYWYLIDIDNDGGNKNCKLEQVTDYETLNATEAEFTGSVIHDYGDVMTPSSAAGWYSQDVSAEMESSKSDSYVAFRWRVTAIPAASDIDYYVGAYESSTLKAYLSITYTTGWQHDIDAVSPGGVAKINGLARVTGIAKVNGA